MSRGFTLLELLLVLIIIMIFLGLFMPKFASLYETRFDASISHLEATLRFLREKAMNEKFPIKLYFYPEKGEYKALYMGKELKSNIFRKSHFKGAKILDFCCFSHPDRSYITFFPSGWVEAAKFHIAKRKDEVYTVFILPLSGELKIEKGYR